VAPGCGADDRDEVAYRALNPDPKKPDYVIGGTARAGDRSTIRFVVGLG
jgi:hypothetical protein